MAHTHTHTHTHTVFMSWAPNSTLAHSASTAAWKESHHGIDPRVSPIGFGIGLQSEQLIRLVWKCSKYDGQKMHDPHAPYTLSACSCTPLWCSRAWQPGPGQAWRPCVYRTGRPHPRRAPHHCLRPRIRPVPPRPHLALSVARAPGREGQRGEGSPDFRFICMSSRDKETHPFKAPTANPVQGILRSSLRPLGLRSFVMF